MSRNWHKISTLTGDVFPKAIQHFGQAIVWQATRVQKPPVSGERNDQPDNDQQATSKSIHPLNRAFG